MKKVIVLLLCAMLLCGTVNAENESVQSLPIGEITLLEDGMQIDLDGDGESDKVSLEVLQDEDGFDCGYRLSVNGKEMTGEGWAIEPSIYALRLNDYQGTLLMVADYGPSDDYETYFYLYEMDYIADDSMLLYAGSILSLPEMMQVNGDIITASVRGNVLCTWYHDADFAFARSMGYEQALCISAYEIPRDLYPMSIIATMNVNLPLLKDKNGSEYALTVMEGENVILCATDDKEWLLVQSMFSGKRGWMKIEGEFGFDCVVGDKRMFSDEVFAGLPFAD